MTGIQDNMTACNNPLWLLTFLPVSSPKYQWKKNKQKAQMSIGNQASIQRCHCRATNILIIVSLNL